MRRIPHALLFLALWLTALPCTAQDSTCWQKGRVRAVQTKFKRGFAVTAEEGTGQTRLLAYSPDGCWEKALQNPTFQWILQQYAATKDNCRQPAVCMAGLPERVEPLLTDRWHQGWPYNRYTPVTDGSHCVTGCVAHAMAQVMRHHRYAACRGSHTYTDSLGCGETLTAVFPPEGYNFEAMPDTYEEGTYTEQQAEAVGRLLSDCGVAVDMRYGLESSSANSIRQAVALTTYFGYDEGMQVHYRDHFRQTEWEAMLRHELAEGRPVLMSAHSPSLAHAFCCDGYDEAGLFHLNLGMAGDADGYYYLPYLTPKQPEWYDPDEAESGMNLLQYVITGIRPAADGKATHVLAMDRLEPCGDSAVVAHSVANMGWNAYEGTVGLWLEREGKTQTCVAEMARRFEVAHFADTAYTDTLRLKALPEGLADGRYRLKPYFRETDGSWQAVRTSLGTADHLWLEIRGKKTAIIDDTLAQATLTLEGHTFPDTVEYNTRPVFSFTLRNGNTPFCGRFYVMLQAEGDRNAPLHCIQYQGIYLEPGEQTTRHFQRSRVPLATGSYDLWLAYEGTLLNDTLLWMTKEPLQKVEVVPAATVVDAPPSSTGDSPTELRDLWGRSLPPGKHRPKGIVLEGRHGTYRKTIRQQNNKQ